MRTLIVSDLHLGGRAALLGRPEVLTELVAALDGVGRLVLLGDTLELREGPQRAAAAAAEPVLGALGAALGPEGELLLVPGNHDHGLVAGWIDGRLESEAPGFLDLEARIAPADAGPLAARLAAAAAPARVGLAYPGVWLREDVYALHGHYADLHSRVPTFERLAAGAMARWVVRLPEDGARPDDYEAALTPLYAALHQLAQRAERVPAGTGASARAFSRLAGGARRGRVRTAALGAGFSAAVAGFNAVGVGPVSADLSGAGLRRGYLVGIREALRRLDVRAPWVIWAHSHRSGPWPGDEDGEWRTAAGGRILNTGSWVRERHVDPAGPYRPGTAVLVGGDGPPELRRLL